MKFKLVSSKRGGQKDTEFSLMTLFGLLIAIFIIFVPLLILGNNLKDQTVFKRNFLALDIATTLTIISNSPGDINLDYDRETFWFSYEFQENPDTKETRIIVTDNSGLLPANSEYPIVINDNLNYNFKELKPKFIDDSPSEDNLKKPVNIQFIKKGSTIEFIQQNNLN